MSNIPNTVTAIGWLAFYECKKLKEIVISDSVTQIKSFAFAKTGLVRIEIPASVREISSAFKSCENLEEVIISGPYDDFGYTFKDCVNLKRIVYKTGLKKKNLGSVFEGCTSIETIVVPNKKADSFMKKLPEELHGFIKEAEPEKKKKKSV